MRDIQKEIQEKLDAIEQQNHVRILLAVESGSRAWGFASPDSDYDVRFIYMHEPKEYLRIDVRKDTIEWQLDEVLDINGWDLKKALLAFAKGNPNIMEWANSPIIYRKAPEWDGIREIAMQYYSEKSALCHYYGTANNTYLSFLTGEQIRYKAAFLWTVSGRRPGIRTLRSNILTAAGRSIGSSIPDGRHRSYSTRSIT